MLYGKTWVNNHAHVLRAALNLTTNKYLLHYLNYFNYQGYVNGGTRLKLTQANMRRIPFNIPPLPEQKVIAEKLDRLLAQVERSKARLQRLPQILKRFRQSVLAAAVSGKLLDNKNRQSIRFKIAKLESIVSDIRYGTSKKCSEIQGATPVLRIPNIGQGTVDLKNLKYADFDKKEYSKLSLQKGDLLLIRSNGSLELVGKVAEISEADEHCLFAGYLIRVRLNREKAIPKFVSFCLQSPSIRQSIEEKARSTSGVNNINSKDLSSLNIPIPTLTVQKEIISQVEKLFTYADKIEQQINSALTKVEQLSQSILAKAFRGELTEQWRRDNPELISGDHSAAALLERIRAERATATATPRKRRKTATA